MSFTDFNQLQRDLAHALLSDAWLEHINVVTRDELLLQGSSLQDQTLAVETLVYLTDRNARRGCGVIIEKPAIESPLENVPGPQGDIVLTCLVLEDPLENEAPATGTLKPADQVGQKILDIAHLWSIEGVGMFRADRNSMSDAPEWEPLRAYKIRLRITANRGQSTRVARIVMTQDVQTISLACATPNVQLCYTLDGTTPGESNPASIVYAAPFVVPAGTMVRAAGFLGGMIQSAIARKQC